MMQHTQTNGVMPRLVAMLGAACWLFLWSQTGSAFAEPCSCGPDFCPKDSRYSQRLEQKKKALKAQGYPDRLLSLLDRGGACFARIDRAPEGFSIRTVANDAMKTIRWDEDNKRVADEQLKKGQIQIYYELNAAHAFKCCNEKPPEERPDWDAKHDLNRSIVIECKLTGSAAVCR